MSDTKSAKLIIRAGEAAAQEQSFSHPLNSASLVRGFSFGQATGLARVGLNLLRLAPGKESFAYHLHRTEEEFIYILSGRGLLELGEEEHELGPGDFAGFPTPSVAHHLKNPFAEELVYLSGGERRESEIADFPRLGKRLVRFRDQSALIDMDSGAAFAGMKKL